MFDLISSESLMILAFIAAFIYLLRQFSSMRLSFNAFLRSIDEDHAGENPGEGIHAINTKKKLTLINPKKPTEVAKEIR